jgi:hypothetical protein
MKNIMLGDKMQEIFPKKFIVEYVFFVPSASNKIELIDNKLVFSNEYGAFERNVSNKEVILKEEDWIQFWNKLDEINVWNWEKEYKFDESEINADGDISKIKIVLNDKILDTFCWCNAPEGLQEFFEALKKLTKIDIQNPNLKI